MALPLKIKIKWGYVLAFLLLVISYFLIFFIISKLANEAKWISHSYAVINTLESVKSEITDAETGVRGYIISKDVRFLQPYNGAKKTYSETYRSLKQLTSDNEDYTSKIERLGILMNTRMSFLADGLKSFQLQGYEVGDDMLQNREPGKNVMDSIRVLVKDLQEEESALRNERSDKLNGFFTSTKIIAITSLIVALFTVLYSLVIYTRENAAKEKAYAKVRAYSRELEESVNELRLVNVELQELKSIEKFAATGRIARTMAHEVRNPLTNISLAAEQIKELLSKNEEADLLLDMVGRNVNRINQLVSDLLNSTRFAQLEITFENINNLLDESLEEAKDRIELKQVKVEKKFDTGLAPVPVDREKIKVAFLNMIVNAIEAMEKGQGVLELRTLRSGERCIIEIKDNGSGMDDETIQKLFEPYFTSKMKGNGLGLTNTQNIILNHKGNISVKSIQGKGSSFTIILNLKNQVEE